MLMNDSSIELLVQREQPAYSSLRILIPYRQEDLSVKAVKVLKVIKAHGL